MGGLFYGEHDINGEVRVANGKKLCVSLKNVVGFFCQEEVLSLKKIRVCTGIPQGKNHKT